MINIEVNKQKIDIAKSCEYARYSECLASAIDKMGGAKEILRLEYESSYSGEVDIDVLLNDGRVVSYHYYYGSCSGCDEWEDAELTDEQIEDIMTQESTIFPNIEKYTEWRKMIKEKK